MRRVVAALTLAFIAFVHAADPVLCSDGCTDDARQSQSTAAPGHDAPSTCLLCQNGIAAGSDMPAPSPVLTEMVRPPQPAAGLLVSRSRRIEHPPRVS